LNFKIEKMSRGKGYGKLDNRWLRTEKISNFLNDKNLNAE